MSGGMVKGDISEYAQRPRFVEPVSKGDALEAIATLAKPLATLTANFKNGQLKSDNSATTIEAMEKGLEFLRVAYFCVENS